MDDSLGEQVFEMRRHAADLPIGVRKLQLGPGAPPDLLARDASGQRLIDGALPQRTDHLGLRPQQRIRVRKVLVEPSAEFDFAHHAQAACTRGRSGSAVTSAGWESIRSDTSRSTLDSGTPSAPQIAFSNSEEASF